MDKVGFVYFIRNGKDPNIFRLTGSKDVPPSEKLLTRYIKDPDHKDGGFHTYGAGEFTAKNWKLL